MGKRGKKVFEKLKFFFDFIHFFQFHVEEKETLLLFVTFLKFINNGMNTLLRNDI